MESRPLYNSLFRQPGETARVSKREQGPLQQAALTLSKGPCRKPHPVKQPALSRTLSSGPCQPGETGRVKEAVPALSKSPCKAAPRVKRTPTLPLSAEADISDDKRSF